MYEQVKLLVVQSCYVKGRRLIPFSKFKYTTYIYSNLWKVTFGLGVNLKISTGLSFAFALIFWHQSLEATKGQRWRGDSLEGTAGVVHVCKTFPPA